MTALTRELIELVRILSELEKEQEEVRLQVEGARKALIDACRRLDGSADGSREMSER